MTKNSNQGGRALSLRRQRLAKTKTTGSNTAWDSEIESPTSLDASLIELDRRKNAAQTPSDCGVGPE